MFAWIADNTAAIIAVSGVIVLVGAAVFSLVRDKKRNKGGCTGNCASCGMSCSCGKTEK